MRAGRRSCCTRRVPRAWIRSRRPWWMSIRAISLSCRAGQERRSVRRRLAKTTLPAPIMAILGARLLIGWDDTGAPRGEAEGQLAPGDRSMIVCSWDCKVAKEDLTVWFPAQISFRAGCTTASYISWVAGWYLILSTGRAVLTPSARTWA